MKPEREQRGERAIGREAGDRLAIDGEPHITHVERTLRVVDRLARAAAQVGLIPAEKRWRFDSGALRPKEWHEDVDTLRNHAGSLEAFFRAGQEEDRTRLPVAADLACGIEVRIDFCGEAEKPLPGLCAPLAQTATRDLGVR